MRSTDSVMLELKWEWPADRQPDDKIIVRVNDVKQQGGGFFGIKRSPSIASNLPDPIELRAAVIEGGEGWTANSVKLILPKLELPGVKVDHKVALGILAKKTCICAARVPDRLSGSGLRDWLEKWACDK